MTARVVVVGAGAFGGWTALQLLRRKARVTLIDAWGPGNARSSSGGETRVIRSIYRDLIYVQLNARALALWREQQKRWRIAVLRECGVLWMSSRDGAYEQAALDGLREAGINIRQWDAAEAHRRFPQFRFANIESVLFEPEAGYLAARRACQLVWQSMREEGGEFLLGAATPPPQSEKQMTRLRLADGRTVEGDHFVFCCGPWLGRLFPALGDIIHPTRQEVFFFGTPPGDDRFNAGAMPAWIDNNSPRFYGIPENEWRGFKIADDTRGAPMDPGSEERVPSVANLQAARDYLAHRFPALRGAPLLEARVCQYENSPDEHFIIDRHVSIGNVWIVGGGSGHGFKHGPSVGELVAAMILDGKFEPAFSLSRFKKQ